MKTFAVVATLLAVGSAAPSGVGYAGLGYAGLGHAGLGYAGLGYAAAAPAAAIATHSAVVPAGPPQAHVTETVHAGAPIAKTYVEHGVVGHRTVQVGSRPVQVGHEYYVADQKVSQAPAYSFQVGEPVNSAVTVPLPAPALPVAAAAPYAAVPPAPVNLGPAPADTVTQEKVLAPARSHTVVTPQVTRVEPELQVNRYAVDVPVQVPVPVEREVLVERRVEKPYPVEVPRAVPVAAPYKVHDVHEIVETPVVREHTVSVHAPAYAAAAYAAHPVAAVAGAHALPAIKAHHY